MNTATPLRSFLDSMKQKSVAARQANGAGKRNSYFVEPLYSRYMGNTGTGEDGRLQPANPTAIVKGGQGPVAIHEGEDLYRGPGGNTTVVPASMSQGRMRMMEKNLNIPGMQTGGEIPDVATGKTPRVARQITVEPPATPAITPISVPGAGTAARQVTVEPPVSTGEGTPRVANKITVEQPAASTITKIPTAGGLGTAARQVTVEPPATPAITNIPTAAAAAATTPAVEPKATSSTYMNDAMARLSEIMNGGSPAQKAIAERQLNELRASQGLQQRVAGFEAAQGGLRPEAASAQRAMGRAVAGSQLAGAASDIAAAEMQQRETSAQTLAQLAPSMQNMEMNKQNQVADLVNKGYTKEMINSQMGTNLSDQEYSSLLGASTRGQNAINTAIASGDYSGANRLLAQTGLPPVDFSKPESKERLEKLQTVPGLINQGYTLDQINAQTGLNLTPDEFSRAYYATALGQSDVSAKIKAGDYTGANSILANAGLSTIDFGKIEAGEARQVVSDIDDMLAKLGDDADPRVVTALTSARSSVLSRVWQNYGIDTSAMTVKNADGSTSSVTDLLKNLDTPENPKTLTSIARISDGVETWLEAGEGNIVLEQLGTNPTWTSLSDRAQGGDTVAATEMGQVLGASMTLESYLNGASTMEPNASQKALLEKYGIWHETKPSTVTTEANIAAIKDKLESGDMRGAEKLYNALTEKEREAIGTIGELNAPVIEAKAKTIVNTGTFESELQGKTYDDPLVKAVLKSVQPTTMSYRNRKGLNDQITGGPNVGTWIKYKTPDGERLLKVTFNGHLNTAGTSDQAYMEFTGIDGTVYSSSGTKSGQAISLLKGTSKKTKK